MEELQEEALEVCDFIYRRSKLPKKHDKKRYKTPDDGKEKEKRRKTICVGHSSGKNCLSFHISKIWRWSSRKWEKRLDKRRALNEWERERETCSILVLLFVKLINDMTTKRWTRKKSLTNTYPFCHHRRRYSHSALIWRREREEKTCTDIFFRHFCLHIPQWLNFIWLFFLLVRLWVTGNGIFFSCFSLSS